MLGEAERHDTTCGMRGPLWRHMLMQQSQPCAVSRAQGLANITHRVLPLGMPQLSCNRKRVIGWVATHHSGQDDSVLVVLVFDLGYLVSQEHLPFAK